MTDGYAFDDEELAPWRGEEHPVEAEHPFFCRCDQCQRWRATGPEEQMYRDMGDQEL